MFGSILGSMRKKLPVRPTQPVQPRIGGGAGGVMKTAVPVKAPSLMAQKKRGLLSRSLFKTKTGY